MIHCSLKIISINTDCQEYYILFLRYYKNYKDRVIRSFWCPWGVCQMIFFHLFRYIPTVASEGGNHRQMWRYCQMKKQLIYLSVIILFTIL